MIVKFKKLRPEAVIPTYSTPGSACFDFYCIDPQVTIPEGDMAVIPTGLSVEVPQGYAMMIYSRSGHGLRGISLGNCVGVIDSDYRGEIMVMLRNAGHTYYTVRNKERFAQGMLIPIEQVQFVEDELSDTQRGQGGFGSTGK